MGILKQTLVVLLLLTTYSVVTQAGYSFAPSLTYHERNTSDNGTDSEAKLSALDIKIGYTLEMGLYFGGMYSLSDEKLGVDVSDYLIGVSAGYVKNGFFGILTYHLMGERDLASGGIKYAGATGFQLDTGYLVKVTDNFSIGPQLSWKDIKYNDQETQGIAVNANYDWNGITPYFAFWFQFN